MVRRILFPFLIVVVFFVLQAAASAATFGFRPGSVSVTPVRSDGSVENQAGAHPYKFVVNFDLNVDESNGSSVGGPLRDVLVELPPGFVGNPEAVAKCSRQEFEGPSPHCRGDSQVGVLKANVFGLGQITAPLYNLAPLPGEPTKFGYSLFEKNVFQDAAIETARGYGLTVAAPNIPLQITEATEEIWGVPADASHDPERVCGEVGNNVSGCSVTGGSHPPYLTLPTSCGQFETTVKIDSKEAAGQYLAESVGIKNSSGIEESLVGCERVPFSPTITARPSSEQSSEPSGLNFNLSLPDQGLLGASSIVETEPEKTEVVLPLGVTINPSAANGIVGCTEAQYAVANGEPGVGCPEASKVGTLVATTPLLEEAIEGSVYLATPHDNPFNSLLGLYIVARAPVRGVLVKQAGLVQADPTTGRLTTTFDELPPLPYSSFELALREGPRAPLITPQACGEYTTVAKLYPFSAPGSATVRTAPFKITSGAAGGTCVSGESQMPAHPTFEAGATSPLAGTYSPFVFRVKRSDGEQRFSSITATLPTGLLGRIAGVPYCSDAAIVTASSRTGEGGGAQENSSPSCPSASQVGTVNVAAGAGSQPYYVQGKVYLAGPYKGAPLSLEIITPAIAGPFDLGSVAVRTALYVNETTAQIHAVSDPLPTILHGIPLDVRAISLQMDRPQFTLNPTNCGAKSVTGSLTTLTGASAPLSNPFAVGGCKGLAFEPTLKLAFTGSTRRTGFPAVKAVLTQPKGQNANVAGVQVVLPKGMLIANAHINNPCTRVQFNSTPVPGGGCPAKSILGTAKVWTPLLDAPEQGNVYFRSNGGERKLPDLVVALKGQIPLQLVGFIDSVGKKGSEVRRVRSRFQNIPDAPVSRFELKLSGGKKGLLQNSKNLCKVSDKANFSLTGQNGAAHDTEPKVEVKCGTGKKKSNGVKE